MLNQRYQAPHLLIPLWCNLCLHHTLLLDPDFNGKENLKEILIQKNAATVNTHVFLLLTPNVGVL